MAVNAVVITVEGVLQKNVSSQPIIQGYNLYHGLAHTYQLLLVTDMYREEAIRWFAVEGFSRHGKVIYNDDSLSTKTTKERRISQVNSLRSSGFAIDFVVEPDPGICAAILAQGFSVLAFIHASYALPAWRPDYEESTKPWAEIEEETRRSAELKAQDDRIKKDW